MAPKSFLPLDDGLGHLLYGGEDGLGHIREDVAFGKTAHFDYGKAFSIA